MSLWKRSFLRHPNVLKSYFSPHNAVAYSAFVKVYLNYLNHYNYFSKDKIKILSELTKCKHTNPFFYSLLPKQWPLCRPCQIWNRSGREWSREASVCVCQSAVALFAYNCTSIWSNWLLWLGPGVLWKRHSKCPSAHFTAHRPWHHCLDSSAN